MILLSDNMFDYTVRLKDCVVEGNIYTLYVGQHIFTFSSGLRKKKEYFLFWNYHISCLH